MKHIKKGKVLIISDIHQDIGGYVTPILDRETDWDYIIFNGDYFDTVRTPNGKTIYGVTNTCDWIKDMMELYGDKIIWHVGNHDVAYLASYDKDYTKTKKHNLYYCSGWTRNKATKFNKNINPDWLDSVKLCTLLGDNAVVSHAGFTYDNFVPIKSELQNIIDYSEKWEQDKRVFNYKPNHWIWDVGACRGGYSNSGSPVWLDWYSEFRPIDNITQIVGHTTTYRQHEIKYNGFGLPNYNIDEMQNCYAIWENGEITIKRLY
jgi:hypothetical protein